MRSEFEKWFKTTEIYESFIRCWNEEQIFRTGEDGEYLDSTVNSHFKTWSYRQTEVDDLNQELNAVLNNWNELTAAIHARTNGTAVAEGRQLYEKVDELQKRVDAFKDHAVMLREAAKSHVYTEREQNILLSQADDIDKILGLEQALKGEG